ncbi:MAG: glutathione synthase [Cycloclasticus pugetii]|jgi:glutathione synthase|uniref:Glutathione synthetase n=2 Tax=Cycloclasticus TaxID=34067 RepID=S5T489_9GAMM|nr:MULTISPECIES: glutathione synthase [Cycloclasticus]AGS38611.1 Glutathione synthetase [Cycloclasticus zancles 78-ME]ATI02282.1 glutathione synthase [Cycloclasticus sp. PY97N]EPD12368.1 glutathione synthetase [Cycloclasticus pugetii]MBV1899787.1 glutathione synthase [Cycloclasticus sp.]
MRLGVVMDPIGSINIKKDTTFAMLLEAQSRGWELFYMEQQDLYLINGTAKATYKPLTVQRDEKSWFTLGEPIDDVMSQMDAILMRVDPPFNMNFVYTTYVLEQAESDGVLVVNKPQSLRDANEKLFTAWFPDCCSPTLVTSQTQRIKDFLLEHEDIIVKPLDGMGGASIYRLKKADHNLGVVLETMTNHGKELTMVQRYLPEIKQGDKRILIVNGQPVPYALARIPAEGETRGNLAAGGTGEGRTLTDRDRWLCEQIGPTLVKKGLFFVGLDVIGDYVTEINVTSPTCVQELDNQFGLNISALLMDCIEEQLA